MEEIVYRGHGPHQRKGGGWSSRGVNSQEELDAALADGWFRTLDEAIEAHDNKAKPAVLVQPTSPAAVTAVVIPPDDALPTRAELEAKATELGIKVHPKHKDATVLKLINEALAAK